MVRKYVKSIKPYKMSKNAFKTSKLPKDKPYTAFNISEKAQWLREGGGSWSFGELASMAVGRTSEAYNYTFRLGDKGYPVPPALRQAAKYRLKKMLAQQGYTKEEVRDRLTGYSAWTPQKVGIFLKNYRRVPGSQGGL